MKLFFVNNEGGGFADTIEVDNNITVQQLFEQRLPQRKPNDFLIRVNRLPASGSQILQEGDRVSITPLKIQGATGLAA